VPQRCSAVTSAPNAAGSAGSENPDARHIGKAARVETLPASPSPAPPCCRSPHRRAARRGRTRIGHFAADRVHLRIDQALDEARRDRSSRLRCRRFSACRRPQRRTGCCSQPTAPRVPNQRG
jgi:hypothetical protein